MKWLDQENQRIRRIQILFAIGIFVHGVVDPVVTYIIRVHFEAGFEVNPLMRWGLAGGLPRFILVHVPLFIIAIIWIWTLSHLLRRASGRTGEITCLLVEFGMNILIAWGFWIVGTNLWVAWIAQ